MKMFNRRITAFASVAAILASVAAMPVSAVNVNAYSVSYETLTSAITTADGNTVPAGTVAVTLEVENNTGFECNTLVLSLDQEYDVMVDENGKPVIQKGELFNTALMGSAVTNNTVCVTAVMNTSCQGNGNLFTFYVDTCGNNVDSGFVTIECTDAVSSDDITNSQNISTYRLPINVGGTVRYAYYGGDANDDNLVNAVDAAVIRGVLADVPGAELSVESIAETYDDYFPVCHSAQPDANGNGWINDADAVVILDYTAKVGSGGEYTGPGAGIVGELFLPDSE